MTYQPTYIGTYLRYLLTYLYTYVPTSTRSKYFLGDTYSLPTVPTYLPTYLPR